MGYPIVYLLRSIDSRAIFVDGRRKLLDLVECQNQLRFYIRSVRGRLVSFHMLITRFRSRCSDTAAS
jgi:hypothetical protein